MLAPPPADEVAAVVFLAVAVTAVAFVCWYHAVVVLGSRRAGLLTGAMPVSALVVGGLLGLDEIQPWPVAGAALVAVGIATGLLRGPLARNDDDRAGRVLNAVLAGRAEQEPTERAVPSVTHDQQLRPLGRLQ